MVSQPGRVLESTVGPTDSASAFSHSLPTPPALSSPNKDGIGHAEDGLMKAPSLCLLYSPRDTVLRLGEGSPSGVFDSCSRGCLCTSRWEGATAARCTRGMVHAQGSCWCSILNKRPRYVRTVTLCAPCSRAGDGRRHHSGYALPHTLPDSALFIPAACQILALSGMNEPRHVHCSCRRRSREGIFNIVLQKRSGCVS